MDDPYSKNKLLEKCKKVTRAVMVQPETAESLDAIGEAAENLRCFIVANIHDDDFMSDILDALQLWEDFHTKE